jgi:sigma-B regulation protein RsbU (phosphoserine phosphatase)
VITESPTLRLHTENEFLESPIQPQTTPDLRNLIDLFPQITGWELDLVKTGKETVNLGIRTASAPTSGGCFQLQIVDMSANVVPGQPCANREQCDAIVSSINELVQQVEIANQQIQRLNAEMATAIPVSAQKDDGEVLLRKLESIIGQGLSGLQMNAGSIYLLDDATQELNLRVQVGMSNDCLLSDPRRLKDALADLDALVGNAVAISDTSCHQSLNFPENFPSAICVPLATHSTPIGTLWLFSEIPKDFSEKDMAIAELVAGRISAELEREAAVREGSVSKKIHRDIDRARIWQQLQTPARPPEIDGWLLQGSQFLDHAVGGALHELSLSPRGELIGSVGDIQGAIFESGLGAATLRGAMQSLGSQDCSPEEFIYKINNTLWNCSLGDQIGSLFRVQLDPRTGIANWANGGQTGAVILGAGAEPNIAVEESPLGACEDEVFEKRDRVILPGSTLFAFNQGFRQLFKHQYHGRDDHDIIEAMKNENLLFPGAIDEWIRQLLDLYVAYRATPDVSFVAIHRLLESNHREFEFRKS